MLSQVTLDGKDYDDDDGEPATFMTFSSLSVFTISENGKSTEELLYKTDQLRMRNARNKIEIAVIIKSGKRKSPIEPIDI